MIQFLIEPNVPVARKTSLTGVQNTQKKIGSPLRGSWICDMCIDAMKTSLTGVQNSKKNRLAARGRCSPLEKKLDLPLACEVKMYFFLSCYCRVEKY